MGEHQIERTITSIFLYCLVSEYDHKMKTLQGTTTYTRAELNRRIGTVYATIRHDRGSSEKVLAAKARNHPSGRGLGRNRIGAGNGVAHTPQDNGNQDGSEEVCRCQAYKKQDHLKHNCSTHRIEVAVVAGHAAGSSGNAQTEKAESGFGLDGKAGAKRPQ